MVIRAGAIIAGEKGSAMGIRGKWKIIALGLTLVVWGCSREEKSPPQATQPAAPEAAQGKTAGYQAVAVENGGGIFGKVTFKGTWHATAIPVSKDPEVCGTSKDDPSLVLSPQGEVQNGVVYIKDIQRGKRIEPRKVTLDQKGCEYSPHVLAFPAGSTVQIRNPDGILHNIHTYSEANDPFNMAQPKFKESLTVTIAKPEIVSVKCDVHPWMSGWFFVAGNPYFSVTDKGGGFSLSDIPPGSYILEVWHEKLGRQTRKVEIEANAKLEVNFAFTSPAG